MLGRTPDICRDATTATAELDENIATSICPNIVPPPPAMLSRGVSLNTEKEYSTVNDAQDGVESNSRRSSFHGQICPPPYTDMTRSLSFSKNPNDIRNHREETASLRDALHATSPHVRNNHTLSSASMRGSQSTLPRVSSKGTSHNGISSTLVSPQLESPQSRPQQQQKSLHQINRQPSRESPNHQQQSTTTSFSTISSPGYTTYNSVNGGTTSTFTSTLPSKSTQKNNNSQSNKGTLTRTDTNSSSSSAPGGITNRPRFPQDYVRQSSDSFKSKQSNGIRRKDSTEQKNNKEANGRAGEMHENRTEIIADGVR